ncbi:c-type cytochrome [Ramlibacter sp. XY19]|uniref:c-type cytochrome n=1 Tax=Ramlibacter paludis TaxID=2908000 RepID=UPI0023DA8808|nr:c-type cytochrome [Ramlibacter paludis]MCG2593555.1 c-type cytochrome [Ramlibacter paludis]
MSRCRELALAVLLLAGATAQAQEARFPGIGRAATPKEVAAWDIDVRPDFQGLPAGSGSVARGQEVWDAKCASCHGVFGESNSVFNPLVGGTTRDDVATGRVARLNDRAYPGRTTMMKLSQLSTLWDYINRAMPWNSPKSLSADEVYAVTAYMLNLAEVVDDKFVLSNANMQQVQDRLPNRKGMTTAHALWPGAELAARAPDVKAPLCMKDCVAQVQVTSQLPDYARDAHGNLADQNRLVGAQRGVATRPATLAAGAPPAPAVAAAPAGATTLVQKNNCFACHAPDAKLVGPSWQDIAKRHAGKADYLAGKIQSGGSGTWGQIPMPPQQIAEPEARAIANWLAAGAPR